MKLYRHCCSEEIEALKENGFEKLTFGGCLFRYIKLTEFPLNTYSNFTNMWKEIKKRKGDERIEPILKTFQGIPFEIPLFEKDILKRQKICKLFVPNVNYSQMNRNGSYIRKEVFDVLHREEIEFDNVFLFSIKVAGFFSNIQYLKTVYCDLNSDGNQILEIDFPRNLAMKFQGKGNYDLNGSFTEYALPMYMIRPEHIVKIHEIEKKEIENMKKIQFNKMSNWLEKIISSGESKLLDHEKQ